MLLGTLGARYFKSWSWNKKEKGVVRGIYRNKMDF